MIPARVDEALGTLTDALGSNPELIRGLHHYWLWRTESITVPLSAKVLAAAEELDKGLPQLTRAPSAVERLAPVLEQPRGVILMTWFSGSVSRGDVRLAQLLVAASKLGTVRDWVPDVARDRLVQGPLADALSCAPLLGAGDAFDRPENREARARLDLLIWEAGASALQIPELGKWVWGSATTFEALVAEPSRGSLRGRALAARCVEMCVRGMPVTTDQALLGRTLQVLQPLLLHPEPTVSTHAARALGQLAGAVEHLEGMLLDWLGGSSMVLRQRGMTAFASLPGARLRVLGHELQGAIRRAENEHWALQAAAAGTPYLFQEARELWDELFQRITAGGGGPAAAKELAKGLGTMWRGGIKQNAIKGPIRELREIARRANTHSVDEWRDWLGVIAATDPVDGAERDPLDVEVGLENLVHLAAQYDDEEADARAARFAESLGRTFEEARRVATGKRSLRHRAAGMNALEGCARAMALRLWSPQLATHPRGEPMPEPDLSETWKTMSTAPNEMLDLIKERRAQPRASVPPDEASLEVLAVRLGGYVLDACGEDSEWGPGRGPVAHDTCRWLRKLEGVSRGRELPDALRTALSSVFWRLVDSTQGTALGAVDDVEWLGPFSAWWALVIDRPAMLHQLATALPMLQEGALERCCELADAIRLTVSSRTPNGQWGRKVQTSLEELHADDTELAASLQGLARSLDEFQTASGRSPDIEALCLSLVIAAERLQAALADPVKALGGALESETDSLSPDATENAPRIANLLMRAIRARELSLLDVWFTSLGPVASALVEEAVSGAVNRTPPPPPSRKKLAPEVIEGYELIKQLGEGGVGKVWLVRRQGADRLFVLKIPKTEALANASDTERKGLLESFIEEANALAGLYHPNVANIIDRGVVKEVPFLVLELLIGADLQEYSRAKLLSLFEVRPIVLDACAGLSALHGAKLVHRDVKPGNVWLRLPLPHGERFDAQKHRDPAVARPLSAVIIDFGMVRPMRVSKDAGGRFVAGTPGYIAPDQVLDPIELDGRADVYALAGTIYNVTTGRTFFDDIANSRDRIFAHMQRDPLEDPALLRGYPADLVRLMKAATAIDPKDRPYPMEFARAFEAAL